MRAKSEHTLSICVIQEVWTGLAFWRQEWAAHLSSLALHKQTQAIVFNAINWRSSFLLTMQLILFDNNVQNKGGILSNTWHYPAKNESRNSQHSRLYRSWNSSFETLFTKLIPPAVNVINKWKWVLMWSRNGNGPSCSHGDCQMKKRVMKMSVNCDHQWQCHPCSHADHNQAKRAQSLPSRKLAPREESGYLHELREPPHCTCMFDTQRKEWGEHLAALACLTQNTGSEGHLVILAWYTTQREHLIALACWHKTQRAGRVKCDFDASPHNH